MFLVDFSRRRQRKISTAKPKGPPKGFMPRSPIGTSNQKRGQKNTGVQGDSFTPTANEISGDDKKPLTVNIDAEEEGVVSVSQEKKSEVDRTDETAGEASELSFFHDILDVAKSHQGGENGKISVIEEDLLKSQKEETSDIRHIGNNVQDSEPLDSEEIHETIKGTNIIDDKMTEEASQQLLLVMKEAIRRQKEVSQQLKEKMEDTLRKREKASQLLKLDMEANRQEEEEASRQLQLDVEALQKQEEELSLLLKAEMEAIRKQEEASRFLNSQMEEKFQKQKEESRLLKLELEAKAENSRLLKLELEEKAETSRKLKLQMEANLRQQEIERIAEQNVSQGNRMFVYPSEVKPDQDIEVFLNRSLSTLVNEPDVLIMGGFNDWKWKSFNIRMYKTHLKGDWWSCQLKVPREAYKVDFVFFNGKSVYDNNDLKDFSIPVVGGMNALEFEDFLLEEKHKELEYLAKEQAERERQAEALRKMEEEKAAIEADRVQARMETEKSRERFQQLIKKGVRSIDNVWHIEPRDFKSNDLVRLYYNRSSGPLSQAKELWIHGGHNNWKDGVSFFERLVPSGRNDGDWWHADGMFRFSFPYILMFVQLIIIIYHWRLTKFSVKIKI